MADHDDDDLKDPLLEGEDEEEEGILPADDEPESLDVLADDELDEDELEGFGADND